MPRFLKRDRGSLFPGALSQTDLLVREIVPTFTTTKTIGCLIWIRHCRNPYLTTDSVPFFPPGGHSARADIHFALFFLNSPCTGFPNPSRARPQLQTTMEQENKQIFDFDLKIDRRFLQGTRQAGARRRGADAPRPGIRTRQAGDADRRHRMRHRRTDRHDRPEQGLYDNGRRPAAGAVGRIPRPDKKRPGWKTASRPYRARWTHCPSAPGNST